MSHNGIKVLTWNCNGALRRKWLALEASEADLLIIQECEDPARAKDAAYLEWAGHYLWTGPTKNKGIGVFARRGLSLKVEPLELQPLQLFLPCRVNGDWPLLATWTMQANSPTFGYIGQLWKFLQAHRGFLDHSYAMLAGDLNSNACWDKWDRWWNHSDVVDDLGKLGLVSAYHRYFEEGQGQETRKTFFLHRNPGKGYHIDYVFAAPGWGAATLSVGEQDAWLTLSDHMPVVATFPAAQVPLTATSTS